MESAGYRSALGLDERSALRPERVEHLVDLAADLDRFVGRRDRAGKLRLAKGLESLFALEEVDAADVPGRKDRRPRAPRAPAGEAPTGV